MVRVRTFSICGKKSFTLSRTANEKVRYECRLSDLFNICRGAKCASPDMFMALMLKICVPSEWSFEIDRY